MRWVATTRKLSAGTTCMTACTSAMKRIATTRKMSAGTTSMTADVFTPLSKNKNYKY